jgi:hypothetical protein
MIARAMGILLSSIDRGIIELFLHAIIDLRQYAMRSLMTRNVICEGFGASFAGFIGSANPSLLESGGRLASYPV